MIRAYESTEKKFNHNGLKSLKPLFAEITKVKDGDYYIEVEDLLDNFEYYQKGMIEITIFITELHHVTNLNF